MHNYCDLHRVKIGFISYLQDLHKDKFFLQMFRAFDIRSNAVKLKHIVRLVIFAYKKQRISEGYNRWKLL